MTPKVSRRLVIDASIARSSGEGRPPAQACRAFLADVLDICHRLVLASPARCEWKKHRSRFASTWGVSMEARKKTDRPEVSPDHRLRREIRRLPLPQRTVAAMLKDAHLIEAALSADGLIVSLDEEARKGFARASQSIPRIEGIVWVNPERDCNVRDWLRSGAPRDEERTLQALARRLNDSTQEA